MAQILDSTGRPVKVTARSVKGGFESRNMSLGQAPGMTAMSRFAGSASKDLGKFKRFAANIEAANPSIRSPLLNQSNFYMPESDSSTGEPNRLLNQWISYYYKWHPLVGNIIDMHSTPGSTLVLTRHGLKKISEIGKHEQVLSASGEWQRVEWQESHKFTGKMMKITATGCPVEEFTYNHPVKAVMGHRGQTRKDSSRWEPIGDPMWIPAERLKKGDFLCFPKYRVYRSFADHKIDLWKYVENNITKRNQIKYAVVRDGSGKEIIEGRLDASKGRQMNRYVSVSEDLVEILGWYAAKGCVSGHNVYFTLNMPQAPLDRIENLLKSVFGVPHIYRKLKKTKNTCVMAITSPMIAAFFIEYCGKGCEGKKIPEFVMDNTDDIVRLFVKSYLAGDEHVSSGSKDAVQGITTSPVLAHQLRIVSTKLGVLWRIRRHFTKRVNSGKNIKTSRECWTLTLPLQDGLPAIFGKEYSNHHPTDVKETEDGFYTPIRSVKSYSYSDTVYDIKTKDHSFTTNFTVHNSEMPLSRFALRGIDDPKILQFYEEMVESAELHIKMIELLRQYFLFGEVIPYAFWSDTYNCFTDLTFLDHNFVYVKGHYLLHSDEGDDVEFYELEPDMMLRNIVKSDDYVTRLLKDYMDPEFVDAVRNNKRLLLSNFSTHMIRHKANWSDLRGTSIVLRCLKTLLYSDKIREADYCYDDQTDVLTERGFIKFSELTYQDKIATVNQDSFELEYHHPIEIQRFPYCGDMYHFKTRRVDVCVTPNHRMLVKGQTGGWKIVTADKVKPTQKFRASVKWTGQEFPSTLEFAGKTVNTKDFLEFAGYYVSEGFVSWHPNHRSYLVGICQNSPSKHLKKMGKCLSKLPWEFTRYKNQWITRDRDLYDSLEATFGKGSANKKVPPFIKQMPVDNLMIFLNAAVAGDGTVRRKGQGIDNITYWTSSLFLLDDIMEIALKCGYAVNAAPKKQHDCSDKTRQVYGIYWSSRPTETYTLRIPSDKTWFKDPKHAEIEHYEGYTYCATVPNGLMVTRRNLHIGIHGNSIADGHVNPKWLWKIGQAGDLATGGYMPTEEDLEAFRDLLIEANNDPIFTIITHYAVNVDAIGLAGKLLPTKQILQDNNEDILTALFGNKAVTTGTGLNFATASVAFRAMMSRYIPIRARVDRYLYHKIFAPVAYANKFFKRKKCDLDHGVRTGDDESNQLIIPQIDWRSKANLLDDGSIKSIISSMVSAGRLPMHLLTEALDLDYQEVRNYLYNEQASVFDPVAIEARKRVAGTQQDPTMMGQPFLPKTNQPVPVPPPPLPTAKKASKKKKFADNLLTVQPLQPKTDRDIQTKINQGKPEKGGNPETPDPMAEALKLDKVMSKAAPEAAADKPESEADAADANPKTFDVLGDSRNKRRLSCELVGKNFKNRKEYVRETVAATPTKEKKVKHKPVTAEVTSADK